MFVRKKNTICNKKFELMLYLKLMILTICSSKIIYEIEWLTFLFIAM